MADATRIARGSTYLITQSIIDAGIRAVALTFIARILTPLEMGVIVPFSLVSILAQMLSDLGFSSALAKYIAEFRGRKKEYSAFLFSGISVKMLTAAFAALVVALAASQLSQLLLKSGDYAILFRLLSVYVLFFCVTPTMSSLLLGLDKIREMAILNMVLTLVQQVSIVILLMFGYGLVGLITGWILGQLAYLIPSALIIAGGKHFKKHSINEVAPVLKTLTEFSWPLLLTNLVVFAFNSFDVVVLLAYLPLAEVGVYRVARQAFTVLYIIPGALSTTLLPYLSEQYGGDKHENITISVRAATRYLTLLFLPLALGLMITANPVITVLAGSTYANGDVVLAVLCLFGAIAGLNAIFGNVLFVYNMTPRILLINIASMGTSAAMIPILLTTWGVAGMAVVKGAAMIIAFILTLVALRRRMKIEFDKQAIWKGWSAAIIMLVAVGLIEQMFFSHYFLPLYIVLGGIVYVIALKILKAVSRNDILLIRNLMGKRGTPIVNVLQKIFA